MLRLVRMLSIDLYSHPGRYLLTTVKTSSNPRMLYYHISRKVMSISFSHNFVKRLEKTYHEIVKLMFLEIFTLYNVLWDSYQGSF